MEVISSVTSVKVSIGADVATLKWADGTAVHLPIDVLFRSSLMQQAISGTTEEDESYLQLPMGVIDAWVEGLHAVEVDTRLPDQKRVAKAPKRCKHCPTLLKCLEAADFLVDKATVTALCSHISSGLFAPFTEAGKNHIATEVAAELCSLPSNLQCAVLAEAKVPLLLQLSMLPEALHQAALHATFPSIAATSSLTLHHPLYVSRYADTFWQVLGKETRLEHLKFSSLRLRPRHQHELLECEPDALQICISKLKCLLSFNFSAFQADRHRDAQLVSCLASHQFLTHLEFRFEKLERDNPFQARDLEPICAVAHLTTLRSLCVNLWFMTDSMITTFGAVIAQLPHLQSLNMNRCHSFQVNIKYLAQYIGACTGLKDLRCDRLPGCVDFIQSICSCSNLEHLDLPSCTPLDEPGSYLGPDGAQRIAQLTRLQELHLSEHGILDSDWQTLASTITCLTRLRVLHVAFEPFEEHFAALQTLVAALPSLQVLEVLNTNFFEIEADMEVCHAVGRCLTKAPKLTSITFKYAPSFLSSMQTCSALQSLNFENVGLDDEGAEALASELEHVPTLKRLNLDESLRSEHLQLLAEPIGRLSMLQFLSLAGNEIDLEGWSALIAQFSHLSYLQELHLTFTFLDTACLDLAQHLVHLSALERLSLENTALNDASALAITAALSKLTAMQWLCLANNNFTCKGTRSLCLHLKSLVGLEHLDLSRNEIGNEGARALAQCVQFLPRLNVVDLQDNVISCTKEWEVCSYVATILTGLDSQRSK